jgi:energy-coupling factor transporter ATPase
MPAKPCARPSCWENGERALIVFDNVSFRYGAAGDAVAALRDVSLALRPGELLALLGANGSGKSTLAQLANGLLAPSEGTVAVEGIDTRDATRARAVRELVGVVFQNPDDQIVATAVEDDVAFGPENLGLPRAEIRARVDSALATVGLTGMERREPHLLSGGQKQRLAIAGALAMLPRYLVLDEPTSMLDPQGRNEVLEVLDRLKGEGHGLILITHDLAEAQRADRVAVLSAGSLVFDGGPEELFGLADDVASWGLELPPLVRLSAAMRLLGVPVPAGARDAAAVAESICR